MPQVDPKFTFWFGVWTNVLMLVAGYGIEHAPPFVAQYAPTVQWFASLAAQTNSVILTALVGISSTKAGPLINVPAITPTVVKVLLVAFVLSAFLAGDPASAQVKRLTGNIGNDLGITKPASGLTGNGGSGVLAALAKPFQDIATFIGDDADGAVALATVIPEIQDGHGQQCWMAMASFGKVVKAHPVPITLHVMTDFQTLRLLAIATNRLCTNVHCTQVFADGSAMAQAASPVPLLIPTLHDLCTKVPQIALVDPVVTPTASPAP